jgi:putative transposase
MLTLLSAVGSLLSFRIRSRASLELEVVALRHQLTVLRRQHPGQPRLLSTDRVLWVWLYRIWPQVLNTMVLVKPATVVQWHRKGFRLYWRRRSRSLGRPRMNREIRDLIRQMSLRNPLWGAPRIHGGLLKLGIDVSQATVGRYLPWRPDVPSPTWRSFLHNHMHDIAAVDMFVVVTARFWLLYALVVLGHDRRPQATLSPFHRLAVCTIATSGALPEMCVVTEPATLSQRRASSRSAITLLGCKRAQKTCGEFASQ